MRGQQARAAQGIQTLPRCVAAQHCGQRARMHARFPAYVQPCQMEAEGLHPPQQTLHGKAAGMFAAIGTQAVEDQLQIVDQFGGAGVGAAAIIQRGLQACAHAVVEQAVRHVGMARARLHLRQQLLVLRHACLQRITNAHSLGRLAEQAGQLQQFLLVAPQHCPPLCIQRVADGGGIHVRVAVHVAAHPGAEAQQARQRQFFAEGIAQRLLQRFVQHRDHPVQHLYQIKPTCSRSSSTVGRTGEESVVCHEAVSAMRKRAASAAASPACAGHQGCRPAGHHQLLFSSSARRTASVGCAVNTGSMSMRGSHCASSSSVTPCAFRCCSASCRPSGCAPAVPARW